MTLDKKAVGRRLKEFSTRFGSLTEFANALGMKRQQLYSYFNGRSLPGLDVVARLKELGLDPNWLINGEAGSAPVDAFKEEKLEYDSPEMRETVEREVNRLVKIAQLLRDPISPVLARELRQALKRWAIKQYRFEVEHKDRDKARGKGSKTR